MVKEYSSTITLTFSGNHFEAKSKEEYLELVKADFYEQHGIELSNDEIIIDDDPTEIPEQTTMTNLVIEEQEKEEDDSIIEDYHNWGMHH